LTKTRSIWLKSLGVGLLMLIGSLYFGNVEAAFSVAIGMAIAIVNFWLLERLIQKILGGGPKQPKRLILLFVAKVVLLLGVLGFVVLKVPMQAGYFLLGLSCIVGGIILEGLTGLFSTSNIEDAS
jgi:hypothetical protein